MMIALILFGIVVLVCAEEVIRLARDARVDMDGEAGRDVFDRRRQAIRALPRAARSTMDKLVRRLRGGVARQGTEPPTVRLPRPDRDRPTLPATTRR